MKLILLFTFLSLNCYLSVTFAKTSDDLNQFITVKIDENEKSGWELFYEIVKDWSGTLITIIGFLIGYGVLRKKLLENHITKAISDVQENNLKLLGEATELMDELIPKTYTSDRITIEDLNDVFGKVKKLYITSQKGSSECQTLMLFIKITLQETIRHYLSEKDGSGYLSSREIYGLVIRTLENVSFYSTKVVTVPKSNKLKTEEILHEDFRQFVTDSTYTTYLDFKQGFLDDPNSALTLMFLNDVNSCSNSLVKRSAFKIFRDSNPLLRLLYKHRIYAPLKLTRTDTQKRTFELFLIGFKQTTEYIVDEDLTKDKVILLYTNPIDNYLFIEGMIENKRLKEFKDGFISESGFSIPDLKSKKDSYETVRIEFDLEYLQSIFEKNKKTIEAKIKTVKPLFFSSTRFKKMMEKIRSFKD